jgi:sRNA-binding carbon storage regulator CsrA
MRMLKRRPGEQIVIAVWDYETDGKRVGIEAPHRFHILRREVLERELAGLD